MKLDAMTAHGGVPGDKSYGQELAVATLVDAGHHQPRVSSSSRAKAMTREVDAMKRKKRKADEALRTAASEDRNAEPETGHPPTATSTSPSLSRRYPPDNPVTPVMTEVEHEGGTTPQGDHSKQDKDKEAVEALLSLHHSHPPREFPLPSPASESLLADPVPHPAHKKLKKRAHSSPADTDSESETTGIDQVYQCDAMAIAAGEKEEEEAHQGGELRGDDTRTQQKVQEEQANEKEGMAVVVISDDDEEVVKEKKKKKKKEPVLPKAVRVTSRTHLVLHQLYLHKRFADSQTPQTTTTPDPHLAAASPLLSTIAANSAPLPSLATKMVAPPSLPTSQHETTPRRPARPSSPADISRTVVASHTRYPSSSLPTTTSSSPLSLSSTPGSSVGAPTSIPAAPARLSPSPSSPSAVGQQLQQLMSLGAIPCLTLPPSVPLWSLLQSPAPSLSSPCALTPILPRAS